MIPPLLWPLPCWTSYGTASGRRRGGMRLTRSTKHAGPGSKRTTSSARECNCDCIPLTTEESMYEPLRYVLIATVLLLAYVAALVIYLVPHAWLAVLGI